MLDKGTYNVDKKGDRLEITCGIKEHIMWIRKEID